MFRIENGTIFLTRGDTAYIDICVLNQDGLEFILSVRKTEESEMLLQKKATDLTLKIEPEDTMKLPFGSYLYDVQCTEKNGDVSTYGPYKFNLLKEITYDGYK